MCATRDENNGAAGRRGARWRGTREVFLRVTYVSLSGFTEKIKNTTTRARDTRTGGTARRLFGKDDIVRTETARFITDGRGIAWGGGGRRKAKRRSRACFDSSFDVHRKRYTTEPK